MENERLMNKIKLRTYNPTAQYFRNICKQTGMTQRALAKLLHVPERTFRDYLSSESPSKHPYALQVVIEAICDGLIDEVK